MTSNPPQLFLRFFRWYCHPKMQDYIEGDLMEVYERRRAKSGKMKADLRFMVDVILLFRPGIIKPAEGYVNLTNYGMIKSYLKIAYRNLIRDKSFSAINILGLTISIVASVAIFKYVAFERSYDAFHENGKYLYRLVTDSEGGEGSRTVLTRPPFGPELKSSFPEVIDFARLILPWSGPAATSTLSWRNQETTVKQSFQWGFYTDPGFLNLFSFRWIKGDRQTALTGINKVVLSESSARKIFGNDWATNNNIIGQALEYVNEFDRFTLTVTGIIADPPENSHFQYDFLASFSTLSTGWGKGYAETWNGNSVYTYLQFAPGTDINQFTIKAKNHFARHREAGFALNTSFKVQPIRDIYLNSHLEGELKVNGNGTYLSFLFFIAIVILLIAFINYINLSTARALKRGHEVGLRKVLGAVRFQLIKQFLFESVMINGLAFLLAIVVLLSISSYLNQLMGKSVNYFSIEFWQFLLILFPISALLSGFYPAFVLSGYQPLKTLKGKFTHSKSGTYLRKCLIVFQFSTSIGLIVFTVAIYRQLNYMRSGNIGFNKEGVLVVRGPVNRNETWIEHDQKKNHNSESDIFLNALTQYNKVKVASLSWSVPGEKISIYAINLGELYNNGKLDVINADNDFARVYELEILAGKFNTSNGVVLNHSAANILGYENMEEAIGKEFKEADGNKHTINGIVNDYHHHSLQQPIRPIMFQQNDPSYKLDSYYSIKLETNNLSYNLYNIELAYKKAYPSDPFEYYFIDSYLDAQYQSDIRFGKLFGIFSGLTIFIACLGLFGLAVYTINIKIKEIGIRKVLGASVGSIVALLTKNTFSLIVLSCALVIPIAFWATEKWLSNYAYRIELGWTFILPALLAPIVVVLAISALSIKTARMNPTDTLREQ